MNENIEAKVVVITGASSGLGEATARYLAERRATVALGARRAERLQALVDAAVERFGRIDVMLNNAGLMAHSPLEPARSTTGTG